MYTEYLNSDFCRWNLLMDGNGERIPARVPGSVYQALLDNGKMEDPYYRDNELKALALMDRDFTYLTEFEVSDRLRGFEEVLLRFEGIDTVADIFLNGRLIGSVCNMHRTFEYPVKELLRDGLNELKVVLHSPTRYIQEAYENRFIDGSSDAMRGFSYLRKAHCMFGWDWGPRLPDAGIWRNVSLVGYNTARLDGVYITQEHAAGRVNLKFRVDVDKLGEERILSFGRDDKKLTGISYKIKMTGPEGEVYKPANEPAHRTNTSEDPEPARCLGTSEDPEPARRLGTSEDPEPAHRPNSSEDAEPAHRRDTPDSSESTNSSESADSSTPELLISEPRLWWPGGYGEQPLYQVEVTLEQNGETLDSWNKKIGLRTLTVHIEKDEYGESFAHEVNGVRIFAMGADYIPEDNILPRVTPQRTRDLLMQAKNANFNCIRVWGGGYYPGDDFWDICDELGLIVWEDFMFACAVYHLTEAFEENITAEFIDNVKRIRHHASLALWCGNNEMESFVESGLWVSRQQERADYIKMYEYIIPKVLREHDPNTFYWPSSPSSGGSFDNPNDPNRGDTHYWDVWHGNKPITEYRKFFFRYVSEFGFQSFPLMKTVETFAEPEDRNIFSYVMEKHQRNSSANGKIMNYMEQTYLYPGSFDMTLYASQLLQAEALRYGVEHFRRNRGRCMGTIIWQLNDCWPVASWATIDYCGRWKAAQYYAKRFFAPILISCEEEGILTQDTNPNAQPYEVRKSIRLNVANEARSDRRIRVEWNLRNSRGEIIRGGDAVVTVPGLSAVWLEKQDCMDADLYENYVSYECWDMDRETGTMPTGVCEEPGRGTAFSGEELPLSSGTVLFCPPKHFHFVNPCLTVEADGDELVVTAGAYAKSVEIQNEDQDMLLSDNYFDMNGGTRRVKILKGKPVGLKIRSVYDIR